MAVPEQVINVLEPRAHPPSPRAHVVQFYSEDAFLLDELSKFIGTALVSGDSAIVIASSQHRDGLAQRLAGRGLDLSRVMQSGRYLPLDAAETLSRFMVDGFPDRERFEECLGELIERAKNAAEGDSSRVAAFGEMVALLWVQGRGEAAIQLEQLWNELGHTRAFKLRCAYPISHFNRQDHAEAFLQICGQHSEVIPGEGYTTLPTEEERRRIISELQQKAQALETEVRERKRIEAALVASQEALRKSHEDLETRVAVRTQELAMAESRLGELSRRLLKLRDEERRRLARELHDSTGQTLAALELNLVMLQKERDLPPAVADRISESIHLTDQALQEIRTISYLLHPPMLDEAGLVLALEWYVEGFAQRSQTKVTLDLPASYQRLPQEMELAIFRIVQEALSNVYRHSGSKSASVRLTIDTEHVRLFVEDAGKGISDEKLEAVGSGSKFGVGIRGMRERARHLGGELELKSADSGTCVQVTLPIRKNRR
jgi:signal transduction histidine kinase